MQASLPSLTIIGPNNSQYDGPGISPVPLLNSVGSREGNGLKYTAWRYSTPLVPTLPPTSSSNQIVVGVVSELLDGEPQLLPINKTVVSFDLTSMRYGCVGNTEAAVPVPVNCTLQVTAVKAAKNEKVMQKLPFEPNLLISELAKATFPDSFKDLQRVDFQLLQSTLPQIVTAAVLDDVSYRANYEC